MTNANNTATVAERLSAERDQSVAPIVVKLLRHATAVFEADSAAARASLARATALLQTAYDRATAGHLTTEGGSVLRGGLALWQIRRLTAYIEANLDSTIRAQELSQLTGRSRSHFRRAFKESFGISPHAYVSRRRIARAQELMLTTDEPLSQISVACGFSDQAHLSRLFRRVTGTTPNAWRRQRHVGPLELVA